MTHIEIDWFMLAAIAWAFAWCVAQFSPQRAYRRAYEAYLQRVDEPEPPMFPQNKRRRG